MCVHQVAFVQPEDTLVIIAETKGCQTGRAYYHLENKGIDLQFAAICCGLLKIPPASGKVRVSFLPVAQENF